MLSALNKSIVGGHRGNYSTVMQRMMHLWIPQPQGAAAIGTSKLSRNTTVPHGRPVERCQESNDLLDVLLARGTPVVKFQPDATHSPTMIQPWPLTNEMILQSLSCPNSSSLLSLEEISCMNRNGRRPKRANHGARPCSRSSRRWKKEQIGKRRRG